MWNFFNRAKAPYRKMIGRNEILENDSDNGEGSSSSFTPEQKDENYYYTAQTPRRDRGSCFGSRLCQTLVVLVSLLIGFLAGQFLRADYTIDEYLAPYAGPDRNLKNVIWSINTTYTSPPSEADEAAWAALLPFGRGFVTHPALTKGETKSITAFHQIHCLYSLRTAYFAQTNRYHKLQHTLHPSHAYTKNSHLDAMGEQEFDLDHVAHCFEYIRQAIMCAADTNLESTRESPEGTVDAEPWKAKRTCRDWEAIKTWSEKWTAGDGQGVVRR